MSNETPQTPQNEQPPATPDPLVALAARIEQMAQNQERQSQALAALIARDNAPAPRVDDTPPADPDLQRMVTQAVQQSIQPLAQQMAATSQAVYDQRGEELLRDIGATAAESKAVREKLSALRSAGVTFTDAQGRQSAPTLEFAACFVLGEQRVRNAKAAPAVRKAINDSAVIESGASHAAPSPAPAAPISLKTRRLAKEEAAKLTERLDTAIQSGGGDLFG